MDVKKENGLFPVAGATATGTSGGSGVSRRSSSVGNVEEIEGPSPGMEGSFAWEPLLPLTED